MAKYLKDRKIGTCENMYYLRLDEAKEYAKLGISDDDNQIFKEYLEDNQTRFRFAWPEEDRTSFEIDGDKRKYDKSFSLPCPIDIDIVSPNCQGSFIFVNFHCFVGINPFFSLGRSMPVAPPRPKSLA